jgi:outer membrane protein OmpA-like peptidoglycan-associated protein
MAFFCSGVNAMLSPQLIAEFPPARPRIGACARLTDSRHLQRETRMLQIEEHKPGCNGQDLGEVVKELRHRNEALRYLTRWRSARESYQAQSLRRSMHAITDGLAVSIPFRTGSWYLEPHLDAHLRALARALIEIPCLQVKLEGFADARGSRRFNQKLSMRRVYAVWTVLARAELPIERMRLKARGDRSAMYAKGDRGGYAFDRRVVISFTLGGVAR